MTIVARRQVTELDSSDQRRALRLLTLVVNQAMRGKLNIGVDVVLGTGTATQVIDDRIHDGCLLFFDPINAAGDTCLRVGPLFVAEADRVDGVATITHATGQQGAAFRMAIFS